MADDCGPFTPDVDLVEALATHLSEIPKGRSDMLVAFGILRHLYDLGIELPTARIDGPEAAPRMTFCGHQECHRSWCYRAHHDGQASDS